jgi:hypothetical protein
MEKSYYQVLTKMKEIALSGTNECYIGDAWEVEAVSRKYPLMVLDPNLKNHSYQNGVVKLNVDIYIVDLVLDDESNELNILSDMTSILLQYLNYIRDNLSDFGFYWKKDYGDIVNFQTFTEKWDDSVAGVMVNIDISIPDDGNLCKTYFGK